LAPSLQLSASHFLDAFRQGLREYGYVEGQNITLEARWAEGCSERFPELVDELVRLKTTVILTVSVAAALAAKNRTTTIPIVFIAIDPVGLGLVPSLARPGGNLTGMSLLLGEEFSGKWLELLRDARRAVVGRATTAVSSGLPWSTSSLIR
jgi:putative tryptophan/tyrosine transport system substrate-binding protein